MRTNIKKQKKYIITLLGLPGSGKGTIGTLLSKELGFDYISTGALVRRACFNGNDSISDEKLCESIRIRVAKGVPQTNSIMKYLLLRKLKKIKLSRGLILDSYPLGIGQIRDLAIIKKTIEPAEHYVLFLKVSKKVIVERLSKRKICPKDDLVYEPSSSFFQKGICRCGAKLVRRDDDKPSVIRRRISEYLVRFDALLTYYNQRSKVLIIDAEKDVETVFYDAVDKVQKIMKL